MKRLITPTAREHFSFLSNTYQIGDELSAWTRAITLHADRCDPSMAIPVEWVLDEIEQLVKAAKGDSALSYERFRTGDWLTKIKHLKVLALRRRFPVRQRVCTEMFHGLSDRSLQVDVRTVYEVDLAKGTVTFQAFQPFSVARDESIESNFAQVDEWN